MSSYYTEKHRHSRRRDLLVAGTVLRRVEVRRPDKSPPPAPAPPPAKEPPKEPPKEARKEEPKEEPKDTSKEKEVPSPPAPEWSKWEPIEGAGWDGHWRAKATEDGEWQTLRHHERSMPLTEAQADGSISSQRTSQQSGSKSP